MLFRISIKTFCLLALVFFVFTANATNYYLSTSGNDANSGTDALTPWQTLNKLNSFKNLKPGDNVLFKRGDTFYGSIAVNNSGTAGNPITFGAYGAGENPKISGYTTLSSWTNEGGGIYSSPLTVGFYLNNVSFNGALQPMGRWPNTGYKTYTSHSGNTSITDATLTGSWTGAEVVIRKNLWITDRHTITSGNTTTLTYKTNTIDEPLKRTNSYSPTNGYGYFIQNSMATLDSLGEWYYDSTAHKLYMYFGAANPANYSVKASTINTILETFRSNISYTNIDFEGAGVYGINMYWANNVTFSSCNFSGMGGYAISSNFCTYITLIDCTVKECANNGFDITSTHTVVKGLLASNISMNAGMLYGGDGKGFSLRVSGDNSLITKSTFKRNGYTAIAFHGSNTTVSNNYVDGYCYTKDDGGGIYTFTGSDDPLIINTIIKNNIVLNGVGTNSGISSFPTLSGIYLDEGTTGVTINSNTIAYSVYCGTSLNNNQGNTISNNTIYNTKHGIEIHQDYKALLRNNTITGNKSIAVTSDQYALYVNSEEKDNFSLLGRWGNNYYARPLDDSLTIKVNNPTRLYYTLAGWQNLVGEDASSKKSPKTITNINDLRFEYNSDSVSKTISLPYEYNDIEGKSYNGSVTLAPYSSLVLLKNGNITNQVPIANAGGNKIITLPINKITLTGSGTDVDGTITNYLWTKISGPTSYSIANASSPVTDVSGLAQGTYQFELKVTDNNGAVGRDTMQITVNAAANIPPVANAGGNKTITLPVNKITLTGSGTDADGTVTNYLWTKISGPSSYKITNTSSSVTDVNGLVQGIYQFELKVTDNNGAIGRDTMQVIVTPAANIPPVANAGDDQSIQLPVNKITLSGSGIDADGIVTNYLWTKISGPSSYSIVNAASQITDVTNLVQGIYQFELKVTDNNGAVGKDTMNVIVNAAIIPLIANAGPDQTITLPVNTVQLSGGGTGPIVAYQWRQLSGPSVAMSSIDLAATSVSGLIAGVYQFELKVLDNNNLSQRDTMSVTVIPAVNIPPVANAGGNKTITLPVNKTTLAGSGTDVDGTIVSYLWTKISGPTSFTIINATSLVTDVTNLIQGIYQFELKVTDDNGAVGKDTMNVTVNAAIIPLTANAGPDQTITLPVNTVQLSGSGTGPIVAYQWRQLSGPSVVMSSIDLAATSVSGLIAGVYQFELKVLDNNNLSQRDTMSVTVNPAVNIPPTANAGGNKNITLPVNKIRLAGTGTDPDGMVVAYLWTKISGPASYSIVNAASPVTDITGLVLGTYQFELKVTDNNGAVGKDTMNVTVNAAIIPLIANAGPDQTITLPVNTVQLFGSGTGPIVAYQWRQLSGPSVVMSSIDLAATSVSGLIAGVYQFELKVLDNNNLSQRDTMQVTVNPAVNIPPVANAGGNKTITLPVNKITLTGTGTDPDGMVVSYLWTKIAGPASFNIVNAVSPVTDITGLVQGTYQFELKVTDNNGAVGKDTMNVIVNVAIIPLIANAGPDQTITLPVNTVQLSGSGTGPIVAYQWRQLSGPSVVMSSIDLAATSVSGLIAGAYQFELKVLDNNNLSQRDTMSVTVNPAANIPPVANAGGNKTITLPVNKIRLAGSGMDADGMVVSYLWTKISGPTSYNIVNGFSPVTDITGLIRGIYQFELKVTDNNGDFDRDTMQITVNAAANIPPVANAGGNQTIQLPVNKITLAGSGTDADGKVVAYLWTKILGPAAYNIVNAASAVTDVSTLVKGTYSFELTVTDNDGAIGKDTMQVIVNAAANIPPVANAGGNKSITLPVNKIALTGSGSDADGSVVSYLWTKISGPNSYSIVNVASPVTDVTGLVQGIYQFELKVTDNNGATGKDTMQITVNAAANIPPVANAGSDITITLPVNSVNLMGSGLDVDGTITGYEWNQVYGPAVALITSDKTASTNIKNLIGGNYAFELTVRDNRGAEGKDTVVVIVALGRISGQAGDSLKIYPNPVKDFATLEINTDKINSNALIIISNSIGKKVYAKSKRINQNNSTEIIEMSNFAKGVYTITVYFNKKEKQSIKVVKL